MISSRFDAVTRWTSLRITRRTAITQAGVGVAAALGVASSLGSPVMARDATPVSSPAPAASPSAPAPISLLFVQNAGPTTLTPGPSDVHTLVMTEVIDQTLYFSDRPYRIVGTAPTATFTKQFDELFSSSPPNASLIGHKDAGADAEEATVVTLLSAVYDPASATLTYTLRLLDADAITGRAFELEPLATLDAPRQYVDASLFIDDVSPPGDQHDPTQDPIGQDNAELFIPQDILFLPPEAGS